MVTVESTPRRLTTRASWLITQTAVHSRRLVAEGFAAAGARGYHYRLLAALHEFGPASQADLGRRCQMDRSDVVAAVTELERAGFVARGADPADRRRNTVTITQPGGRQLHQLDDALDQVQDDLLAPLTPTERQTLITLLGKVLDHHSTTSPTIGD